MFPPPWFAELANTVTAEERNAAKPANFGLPAGMGVAALTTYARLQFGQEFSEDDARGWREAWLSSFPEMREFIRDGFDFGMALAKTLNLTLADYSLATKGSCAGTTGEKLIFGWLGTMARKVLREPSPTKRNGEAYSPSELDFFWTRLQQLRPQLDPIMSEALKKRKPSQDLVHAVEKLLNQRGVFTLTGRLRAKASYSARRNTVFQGAAADGAKLALYRLWRAGFRVVAFIHDEFVVEVPVDVDFAAVKQQIDGILISSMK